MPRSRQPSLSRHFLRAQFLRIIIHRRALRALAVNPYWHYVSALLGVHTMSPDLIDQTILAHCKSQFRKVARIVGDVAIALKVPMDVDKDFIADRIKALVKAERLHSQG